MPPRKVIYFVAPWTWKKIYQPKEKAKRESQKSSSSKWPTWLYLLSAADEDEGSPRCTATIGQILFWIRILL
jgi:hypothetical protein